MRKVLIANRGEIAVRIVRTCREMGLQSVAVYSECDRDAMHVRFADEAYGIGPDTATESYLRIDKMIDVARRSGADAVHPGYGFLAENPEFAAACREAGVTFIGPTPEAMARMGSKTSARQIATAAGVPVVPGTAAPFAADVGDDDLLRAASAIGYPLLVKAVAGGGGKGMRTAAGPGDLLGAVRSARSEGRASFGDAGVFLERAIENPRHIEVQLLGDAHGTVLAFVERECSLQRRHQKLIEETPSASVSPRLRKKLLAAATAIGQAVGYTGAGTLEFLVDRKGRHYFLEMNTRLQVEHPVTEAVTGIDFVRAQIEIAQGLPLAYKPAHAGHAIECRIYAEDPEQRFLPSPGTITHLRAPAGPGVRDDGSAVSGSIVTPAYDPLISKLVAWGPDRPTAIARMKRALGEYDVRGIKTTIGFCRWLLDTPAFADAAFDTTSVEAAGGFVDGYRTWLAERDSSLEDLAVVAAALHAYRGVAAPPRTVGVATDSLWTRQARLEGVQGLEP